jgi:hypothetical protein
MKKIVVLYDLFSLSINSPKWKAALNSSLHSGNSPDLHIVCCVAGRNGRTAQHSTCYKEKHNGKDHETYTETKIRELAREFRLGEGEGVIIRNIYMFQGRTMLNYN